MRALLSPTLLVLLALSVAACGGSVTTGAALGDGAQVAPASAHAYAAIATDADDEQWRAALALLERFPDADGLLAKLRELESALGPELVLVALGDGGEGVALTRPDDPAELRDRLSELSVPTVTRAVDGWTAIAAEAAHLDRLVSERERGALADDPDFEAALDGLPEQALAHGFVRGEDPEWAGGAVVAGNDGLRFEGRLAPDGDQVQPYAAELLDRVPDDALVVVSFQGREGAAALDRLPAGAAEGLRALTGMRLDTIAALAEGEGALVVRRGLPFPELTLHLRIDGDEAAAARLEDELRSGGLLRLHATAENGVLTITSAAAARAPAGGERLADDETFRAAVEQAGMPDETTGFTYVDAERALPLLEQLGALLGGAGADARGLSERLAPLRTLLLFGGPDRTVGGFAAIR